MKKRKLGRKLLSFLLTLAMVLGLMPGMTARAAGNGTEASPIEITSWNELSSAMSGSTPNGESADSPTYYKLTQNVEDTSSSGAIEVGNGRNVVLDLNGKTINRKLTSAIEQGYVIKVEGNLTIKDSDTGGTITGGNITDSLGGGVYINQNAKFNMKGGTISGNTADNAGGVYVDENAEFTMEGGTISGNTALGNGGGVFINQNAKFNMKGGTISGNSAEYNGGGVYLYYDAEFCLSGRPIINNNKLNDGNTVNVHILDGTIKLTGALESGASVGVTMDTPGVFTSSVDPIKASVYKDCFSSDNSTYTVTTDGNELKLSSHEHIFTYSAAGATITATCNASDRETTCPLKDNSYKATLTIGTPTGEDGKAVLAANPSGSFDLSALQSTIKYSSKQSSGWSTESTTPPTGDGFHKAAITLGEGDKAKTASVTYGRNVITYNSGGNGSVSGTASATVGSKIEFTVTPSANYTIDAITVKDADNQNVTLTGNAFTMPEKNVTVSATFKAIAYTVTVNGGKATVKDNTPNPVTFTAELKVPNDKMYDGTPINLSTATVEKSDGFPSQVEVGTISYKDQAGNAVTNPTNVGTYTASVSVGDKTISKSFKITGRTPSITYTKTTKSGNSYVITKTTTDQYIPLENNAGGITLLDNGRTYVAEGNLTIGALIFKGDAKLILRKDSKVTVRAGIYHIGSTLELYTEEGGENAALDVKGDTALSGLTNYSDYSSQVEGGGSSLSGTILIYGGKVTVEKGENTNFVANDISMTVGAGISAKGLTSGSDLSELTGGTENSDGSVTYTFTDLSQFSKLFIEYRIPSSVTTAPTAKSLTYSGTAQELVTAGEATGGTMQYALGTKDAATEEYTTTIPTGTEVGT